MDKVTHTCSSIDEYIAMFPKEAQEKMQELRKFIKATIPEVTETISYKMPAFNLHGKYFVYFGGYKKHIGFYPFPSGLEAFQKEASEYVTTKGAIQFPLDKPIPFDLVKKILKFREKENLEASKESD